MTVIYPLAVIAAFVVTAVVSVVGTMPTVGVVVAVVTAAIAARARSAAAVVDVASWRMFCRRRNAFAFQSLYQCRNLDEETQRSRAGTTI